MGTPLCRAKEPRKYSCLQLAATCGASNFRFLSVFVCKASESLGKLRSQDGFRFRKPVFKESLRATAVSWSCSVFAETGKAEMEDTVEKIEMRDNGSGEQDCEGEPFSDSGEDCRQSNSSSEMSSSSISSRDESQSGRQLTTKVSVKEEPELLSWPMRIGSVSSSIGNEKKMENGGDNEDDKRKLDISDISLEIEMMKERFAKLLLGEDMSGCGKGVCSAMAISNAITNLSATVFGQLWRLEPLPAEKKLKWRREMGWILSISDYIVEFQPSWQTFHDGNKLEVMRCHQRSDLYINLPALRKLDNMLIEALDSFLEPDFWYVDQALAVPDTDGSASFRRTIPHQEKWWLPSPRVPPGGLPEKTRMQFEHKRECTNQILKAAMAINSNALAEIEVPQSYIESLPKNGRASLGDMIYRCITSEQFSPEHLLDCLDLSSEYHALEIANRVEAATYIWRRSMTARTPNYTPSWGMVRELMADGDKRELLAGRADGLLLCLKQRFPGLTQTTLDMSKIQFNKDVGKSILEAYSRVLESLAFNIIARIDDLLYVDNLAKDSNHFSAVPAVSIFAHKRISIPSYSVPVSGTTTTSAPLIIPARGGVRSPLISRKANGRGFGVRKVLTEYLGKSNTNLLEASTPKQSLKRQ